MASSRAVPIRQIALCPRSDMPNGHLERGIIVNTDLLYLALVSTLTAFMWVPYILNAVVVRGLTDAVGYPADPKPLAPWAQRMKAAHYNAVENLAVFAALVLTAQAAGANNEVTATACMVYFWARVAHFLVYAAGVPWVRTLSFFVGFLCQIAIAWQILT
jgi:uncharacterized MAPEG superfamily protein